MMTREPDDPRLTRISLRRELIDEGLTDKAIRRLLADGTLHRLRYGAYVSGAAWSAADETDRHALVARAVLKRACTAVALSHLSALVEWDVPLWDTDLSPVHLTRIDQRAGRREAGVVQHLGALRDGDVTELNGIPVTAPARTALDSLGLVDVEHGLTIVNDLLYRGLTTIDELQACRIFMEQWPRSLSSDVVLRLADPRCGGSIGEGRTFHLCWRHSLPMPVPQYPVTDRFGRIVAYLDFAWPTHRAFVEFDGKSKYQELLRAGESPTDVVLREKRREDLVRELTGWSCIRLVWADLYRPEHTAARIRDLLTTASRAS
jgi:hypothetical protein